jgi:hypothetical protein
MHTTELAKQIKEIRKILKTHSKNKRFNQTTISVMESLLSVAECCSARQEYAQAVSSIVLTCKLKIFKL